ncbi:MAG: TonB-dependent receptor domain-containing protein [Vicinamibacterales bacterium]
MAIAVVMAGASPPPRAAQQSIAAVTVTGQVTDGSGAAVPGATVTVATPEGTVVGSTQSGRDGSWRLAGIPSRTVRLVAQLAGFRAARQEIDASGVTTPVVLVLQVAGYTDEVIVSAARDERTLAAVPSSVGVISGAVLEQAPGVNLAETLKFVPGVAAGNVSGVDDLRISIRGAGIRSGFGSRGVILMADGFPVTEPDGQTPHFDGQIDLANAERVEVVKGPASAVYGGAALGGVVNVITSVPARRLSASLHGEAGSYEFGKVHAAASGGAGPFVVGGTLGYTHLDGFREHNSLRNWAGTGRADWSTSGSRLSLTFLGTDASLRLPGTLNREQFDQDPSQVRDLFISNDYGRDNQLFRFGGRYEHQLGPGQSFEVDSYGQTRNLFHPIFVVIDQNAARYVGHARYRLRRGAHAFAAGVDLDNQWVDDRWFVSAGGEPGLQIRDDDNTVTNAGFYIQDEIAVGARTNLTLGLRHDAITYDLVDQLPGGSATDRRRFRRTSPKIGVTARVAAAMVAYGNVATGFEAPTLGEVRLPAGFNEIVRPQKALSFEGGLRGQSGAISFDVALYRLKVDDEILPETINNVTVYRNVAEASHSGAELSVRTRLARSISIETTYAYSRFILERFGTFSGNRLPGIPTHMGTVRTSYAGGAGWDGGLTLVFAGKSHLNDANTREAPAYAVVSAQAGRRIGMARLFVRVENLGDVLYTNRPQVNDSGGFFFYPAPGRSGSAGVELRW